MTRRADLSNSSAGLNFSVERQLCHHFSSRQLRVRACSAPNHCQQLAASRPQVAPSLRARHPRVKFSASRHNACHHHAPRPRRLATELAGLNCAARCSARLKMPRVCCVCCSPPVRWSCADAIYRRRAPALAALARYYASKCKQRRCTQSWPHMHKTDTAPPQHTPRTRSSACPPSPRP